MELNDSIINAVTDIRREAGLSFMNVECASHYLNQLISLTKDDMIMNPMLRKVYNDVVSAIKLIEKIDGIAARVLNKTK